MLKDLADIGKRLIDGYDPEKIILFGSHEEGSHRQGSDIDLMIVKETDKGPIERRMEVEALLADRSMPIDVVVYTPAELRYLYSIGRACVEEVVEKGRLIYMRKATRAWMNDVEEELESADILYEHGKYKAACYHSQQAVEKGLKALIIEQGKRPERTHDTIDLYNIVVGLTFDTGLSMDKAVYLNSGYKGRYPTEEGLLPHGEPSQEEAQKALSSARRLTDRLKSLV